MLLMRAQHLHTAMIQACPASWSCYDSGLSNMMKLLLWFMPVHHHEVTVVTRACPTSLICCDSCPSTIIKLLLWFLPAQHHWYVVIYARPPYLSYYCDSCLSNIIDSCPSTIMKLLLWFMPVQHHWYLVIHARFMPAMSMMCTHRSWGVDCVIHGLADVGHMVRCIYYYWLESLTQVLSCCRFANLWHCVYALCALAGLAILWAMMVAGSSNIQ
jgi:hypothetical protein